MSSSGTTDTTYEPDAQPEPYRPRRKQFPFSRQGRDVTDAVGVWRLAEVPPKAECEWAIDWMIWVANQHDALVAERDELRVQLEKAPDMLDAAAVEELLSLRAEVERLRAKLREVGALRLGPGGYCSTYLRGLVDECAAMGDDRVLMTGQETNDD